MQSIIIEFPQGAAGSWLSTVINCCISGSKWQDQKVNFHTAPKIKYAKFSHSINNADLSIDNAESRFIFWKLYVKKRILAELDRCYYKNRRYYVEDASNTLQDNFFWLINQCRYIQSFKSQATESINWMDIWDDPDKIRNQINCVIEDKGYQNRITPKLWTQAINNIRQISKATPVLNLSQITSKIWALAYLQNQHIWFNENIFENLYSDKLTDFILDHRLDIVNYTNLVSKLPDKYSYAS